MRRFHSVSGSCGALAGKTVLLSAYAAPKVQLDRG